MIPSIEVSDWERCMKTNEDVPSARPSRRPKQARWHQATVRTLVVLVACSGAIFWAGRVLWEYRDPAIAEARAIQARAIGALSSRQVA
jgi:hypothetical protein